MQTIDQLNAECETREAGRKRRVARTGSFTPEQIVEKFFAGELCYDDGEEMTDIYNWTTPEIRDRLLDCLRRYKK